MNVRADDTLAQVLADFLALDATDPTRNAGALLPDDRADDKSTAPDPFRRLTMAELRDYHLSVLRAEPDRADWGDAWFTDTDPGDVAAMRAMWGSVLISCLRGWLELDCENYKIGANSIPIGWVGSRDFHDICDMVGINGTALAERLEDEFERARIAEALSRSEQHRVVADA